MSAESTWTTRYPDHREGVEGVDRRGSAIDFDNDATLGLILALCRHLRMATLVGHPAPTVADMDRRLRAPQIGDLVVETTTGLSPRPVTDDRYRDLGYLIERRTEWQDSAADRAELLATDPEMATEDNRSTEEAWYIQYGPDPKDVCRWVNCEFMVVPTDPRMFDR